MNDYITLDGKRYKTPHAQWAPPSTDRPMIVKRKWNGGTDVVFGPASKLSWRGAIIAPVTATAPYGTIADLRTTYNKLTSLAYTDHYGTSYTVVMDRMIDERSLAPDWASTENEFHINVTLIKL